ncbi:hypothetical protein ABZ203_26360, partial [Streptomyces albidoflavus]
RAYAGITQPNDASHRLHTRFGFRPIGTYEQVAGVHAVAASASSARTHQTRWASPSAEAAVLASGSLVAIRAYQASLRSPGR